MRKILVLLSFILVSCSSSSSYLYNQDSPDSDTSNDVNVLHNQWIYDKMIQHYFWNYEIKDSLSLDFTLEPSAFFKNLLSSQDRFSWCELNKSYSGSISGLEFQKYLVHGSIVNRVLDVSSPYLIAQGLKRGDYFRINDSSIIEKIRLKDGKFYSERFIDCANTRGTNLAYTVPLDSVYFLSEHRIGYFIYDQFVSSADVAQIVTRMKYLQISDLVIDLRYNPGGYVSTSCYLASMLAPKQCLGKLYQLQRFNHIQTVSKQVNGGAGIDSVFFEKGYTASQRNLDLKRLVVLTTKNTASASEALIIGLRPYMKVITIGTTSCGKDVGSYTIADNRYKYQLQPITFRYYNALNDSTPVTGIVPDIQVQDDLSHQRGDTNEALLHAAINYLLGIKTDVNTRSTVANEEREYGKSSIQIKNNL